MLQAGFSCTTGLRGGQSSINQNRWKLQEAGFELRLWNIQSILQGSVTSLTSPSFLQPAHAPVHCHKILNQLLPWEAAALENPLFPLTALHVTSKSSFPLSTCVWQHPGNWTAVSTQEMEVSAPYRASSVPPQRHGGWPLGSRMWKSQYPLSLCWCFSVVLGWCRTVTGQVFCLGDVPLLCLD